jgi:single-stranded-DNA-specific exonuclease
MMIRAREVPESAYRGLTAAGMDPILARIYAARGVVSTEAMANDLEGLIAPGSLAGMNQVIRLLEEAIDSNASVCIIADYDCDGASACAVAVRGLRMFGLRVDYLVPNRREHGYGLTPPIVELALRHPRLGRPDLLITVDNGIASHEGVAAARAAGLKVLVTDHHLPASTLPAAHAIVNPNQPGCMFPSKHLAGVGVMFYVLAALRSHLRLTRPDHGGAAAPVAALLDLVALGTVADVVRLDENNRRLIQAGLKRIRNGRGCAGIRALMLVAGRDCNNTSVTDLGFTVGPRINAAGRLSDISLGIACLLSDDESESAKLAAELDGINRERREIEQTMREQAFETVGAPDPESLCVVASDRRWHEGVVGLVASQLKSQFSRPAFAFAPAADGRQWRGSGRSVPGVHLRDALDLVSKRAPSLITRFGGHAMAAGLTLADDQIETFRQLLNDVLADTIDPACLKSEWITDGELDPENISARLVLAIQEQVWGQGFPEPTFHCRLRTASQRRVGERHLKLELASGSRRYPAIAFGRDEPAPAEAVYVYRPAFNDYRGQRTVQLVIEAIIEHGTI